MGLDNFIELFVAAVNVQTTGNFRLLRMNRGGYRGETRRMRVQMLHNVFAEAVVSLVARCCNRLGRFESHVVPAEILERAAGLAEALRAHSWTGGTLAGEETGGEGSDRFGFAHLAGSLLADNAATEAADGTRTGGSVALRRSGRCEHRPAEILLKTIRNVLPEFGDFLGRAAAWIDLHHGSAVDHRGREIRAV